jgi:hypothetical protein
MMNLCMQGIAVRMYMLKKYNAYVWSGAGIRFIMIRRQANAAGSSAKFAWRRAMEIFSKNLK